MFLTLVVLALIYAFLNGYRDSSSILAGVIASRSMKPRLALYLVAAADLISPFFFGLAVARSIATGLIDLSMINLQTIVIAMFSAVLWSLFSWWQGIPSSSTHAMIGGLLGAALIEHGPSVIVLSGLAYVVLPLLLAPIIGFLAAFLGMKILILLFAHATPKINITFRRIQIFTMVTLAMSNSSNDAQKSMGIIAIGLLLAGKTSSFTIPFWVIVICAVALALGASRGDWRQIRTLGRNIYLIQPSNALVSQLTSTGLIFIASALGMPVSTPHVISSALIGAGASERLNKVRWQVAGEMVTTWMLTIPATMIVSSMLFMVMTGLNTIANFIHQI